MHTYHGYTRYGEVWKQSIWQFAIRDRFRRYALEPTLHPLLASYEPPSVQGSAEELQLRIYVRATETTGALPPGICISTGLYFFDIELYAVPYCGLPSSSPSRHARFVHARNCAPPPLALPQVSSLHILANLRISILSITWLPKASAASVTCIDITIQWPPWCWGPIVVENLGHQAKLFAQRLNGSSVIFR